MFLKVGRLFFVACGGMYVKVCCLMILGLMTAAFVRYDLLYVLDFQ